MGNCSTKKGELALSSNNVQKPRTEQGYVPMNLDSIIATLEGCLWRHALLTWIFIPIFGSFQAFIPFLEPSCETGFADISLIIVLLYEAHHIFCEYKSWYSMTEMIAPPEIAVLRHIGALRRRRRYWILGIIESLDLYTDVTFPWVARSCSVAAELTSRWKATWTIPVVGPVMCWILDKLKFTGFCLAFCVFNVAVSGILGLLLMRNNIQKRKELIKADESRITGEVFFHFAQSAETAMMPTVAMLGEEIASQRKYKLDTSKESAEAMKARQKAFWTPATASLQYEKELRDHAEEERIRQASNRFFIITILVKVIVGNCMQLYLHSVFYALTYNETGLEAKIKVCISIACSSIQALCRANIAAQKMGGLGVFLAMIIVGSVLFSWTKIYFISKCETHLWNLTSGCVDLD
jgi:hypothetical protein